MDVHPVNQSKISYHGDAFGCSQHIIIYISYYTKSVQIKVDEQLQLKCNRDEYLLLFGLNRITSQDGFYSDAEQKIQSHPMYRCVGIFTHIIRFLIEEILDKTLSRQFALLFIGFNHFGNIMLFLDLNGIEID